MVVTGYDLNLYSLPSLFFSDMTKLWFPNMSVIISLKFHLLRSVIFTKIVTIPWATSGNLSLYIISKKKCSTSKCIDKNMSITPDFNFDTLLLTATSSYTFKHTNWKTHWNILRRVVINREWCECHKWLQQYHTTFNILPYGTQNFVINFCTCLSHPRFQLM